VPDEYLMPVVRGLLDGDGTISNFMHAPTRRAYPNYRYERLSARFNSASESHIRWLRSTLKRVLGIDGYVGRSRSKLGRHDLYTLRYGKRASITLLTRLYEDPAAPRLMRKWRLWNDYAWRIGAAGGT